MATASLISLQPNRWEMEKVTDSSAEDHEWSHPADIVAGCAPAEQQRKNSEDSDENVIYEVRGRTALRLIEQVYSIKAACKVGCQEYCSKEQGEEQILEIIVFSALSLSIEHIRGKILDGA